MAIVLQHVLVSPSLTGEWKSVPLTWATLNELVYEMNRNILKVFHVDTTLMPIKHYICFFLKVATANGLVDRQSSCINTNRARSVVQFGGSWKRIYCYFRLYPSEMRGKHSQAQPGSKCEPWASSGQGVLVSSLIHHRISRIIFDWLLPWDHFV